MVFLFLFELIFLPIFGGILIDPSLGLKMRIVCMVLFVLALLPCIVGYVQIRRTKPAKIVINKEALEITPISIFGLTNTTPDRRSLKEFRQIELQRYGFSRSISYRMVMRSKSEKPDVYINTPDLVSAKDYAAKLALTLNMKFAENA
jgi:hypothetical protein